MNLGTAPVICMLLSLHKSVYNCHEMEIGALTLFESIEKVSKDREKE
jgi:hypothetical protein